MYAGWRRSKAIDPFGGFLEISRLRPVDVTKNLWVAVVKRKPGALHLHHDAMTALKRMEDIRHHPFDLREFTRHKRLRFFETVSKLPTHRFTPDQLLKAIRGGVPGLLAFGLFF